jgi:chromosome partitioning protein
MTDSAHVIVLGNAKGGSGKSTSAMHIITRLLALDFEVCAIDLDGRQQTLARYIENRRRFCERKNIVLPQASVCVIESSTRHDLILAHDDERLRFEKALVDYASRVDFIVIDCPGTDNFLSRLAHASADTLITPMNDSFVDMDLLARIDGDSYKVESPSWYSEMVWEQRKARFLKQQKRLDWVVMRNRVSHTDTRNKRHMQGVLDKLGPRIGFRQVQGLSDRVIYRELFLKGLTLSDLRQKKLGIDVTMSHVTAHQELRDLVTALHLPGKFA